MMNIFEREMKEFKKWYSGWLFNFQSGIHGQDQAVIPQSYVARRLHNPEYRSLVTITLESLHLFIDGLRLIGHPEDEIIPLFNETGNIASRVVFFDQKIGGIGYLKETGL